MPPVVIGAGIAAVGSVAGATIASSAAKKASKAQTAAANTQIEESRRNQAYITGLEQPAIDRGNAAGDAYGKFLGLNGAGSQQEALDTFRGSTGYTDLIKTATGAVNSNAYARGLGASGATLKALQARATSIADQSAQSYLGNLSNLNQTGQQAVGTVAGVAQNTTNNINGATQNAANGVSNAALTTGASWTQALQNIANTGASALGSSYAGTSGRASTGPAPTWGQAGHEDTGGPGRYVTNPFKINVWG